MLKKILNCFLLMACLFTTKIIARDFNFFIGVDYGRSAYIDNEARTYQKDVLYGFNDKVYGNLFLGSIGAEMGIGSGEWAKKFFKIRAFLQGGYGKFGTKHGYKASQSLPSVKIDSLENYYAGFGAEFIINLIPFDYFSLGLIIGGGYDFVASNLSTKGSFQGSSIQDSNNTFHLSGFDGRYFYNEIYGKLGVSVKILKTQRLEFSVRIPNETKPYIIAHHVPNPNGSTTDTKEYLKITTPTWLASYKILF